MQDETSQFQSLSEVALIPSLDHTVSVMRVLIIKTEPLEEIILSLPVLDYLHKVFRGIEVDWLADYSCLEILSDHPLVSRTLGSSYGRWRSHPFVLKSWREAMSLKEIVRERAYDLVFDLEGTLLSGVVSHLSKCRRRYGLDATFVADQFNLRFNCNRVPLRRQDQHLTDRALRMASIPFGRDHADLEPCAEIPVQPDDEIAAKLFMATLSDGLVFVFHLGTGSATRLWHETGWIELGRELLSTFAAATILLSGNDGSGLAERVAQGIGRQTRFLPPMSLSGLAAILRKSDLVVAGDSVPLHLAAATMTPTVSFYRSTDARTRAPRGEMHRSIQSPLACSRCQLSSCAKDAQCRESIKAGDLADAAMAILLNQPQ